MKKIFFLDTNVTLQDAFSIFYFQDEPDVFTAFFAARADHRILSSTFFLRKKYPKKQVILVSKDVNLRSKVKFSGLQSQDDYTDKIEEFDKFSRIKRHLENMGAKSIDRPCSVPYTAPAAEIQAEYSYPNEYLVFRNDDCPALSYCTPEQRRFERSEPSKAYGMTPQCGTCFHLAGAAPSRYSIGHFGRQNRHPQNAVGVDGCA